MRIEAAVRQTGGVHDRVHANCVDAVAPEQQASSSKNPIARFRLALMCGPHPSHPYFA